MPKIPDFSKFDLQSIINNVKSIINPEPSTPKVAEGDPIGVKIVQVSTLLQSVAKSQEQSAKDLNQINSLLSELYKDLEAFRKLESEFRQKQQQQEAVQAAHSQTGGATGSHTTGATSGHRAPTTGRVSEIHETSSKPEHTQPQTSTKTSSRPSETTPGAATGPGTPTDKEKL